MAVPKEFTPPRNDKVIENMVERHPLKKILSSNEVAKMASFLISRASK